MKLKFLRRKGYAIRGPRDIGPLVLRVLLHWKVPRIEIQVEHFALLDAQRTQLRLRRLSERLEHQTGGLVAIAVLMVGLADMVRTWNRSLDHMAMLVAIALGAGLAARIIARLLLRLWIGVQLLLLRRRIRRTRSAAQAATGPAEDVVRAARPAQAVAAGAEASHPDSPGPDAAPLHGGCACGAVTFTLARRPLLLGICHCANCRKSGMGMVAFMHRAAFTLGSGADLIASPASTGDCGRGAFFCTRCGTTLGDLAPTAATLAIAAQCLDDARDLSNGFHQFVDEKPAWLQICDTATQFARRRPE